jgi:hypothetical protein
MVSAVTPCSTDPVLANPPPVVKLVSHTYPAKVKELSGAVVVAVINEADAWLSTPKLASRINKAFFIVISEAVFV